MTLSKSSLREMGRCPVRKQESGKLTLITARMTYFSAHTKYALVYKGVKYDSVTAEYV